MIGRGASGKPSARSTFARVAREGRTWGARTMMRRLGKRVAVGRGKGNARRRICERRERGPGGGYVRNALGSARGGRDGAIERARGETASPRYLPPNARARGARRREECRTWPLRRRRVARVEARRRDRRAGAPAEDRGRGGRFAGDRARLEGARDRLSARARGSIRLVQVSIIIVNFSGPNAIDERTAADALKSVSRPRLARPRIRLRALPALAMGDAAVADEGDWYAALAAGEDVGDWLDTLANAGRSAGRRERAARALAAKVAADATYAEEAREARATLALEKTLAALDASPGPEAAPSRRSAPRSSSPWPRARARARARPSATSPSRATASCAFASWRSAAASARSCGTPR